jgi:hypothetical protein
LLASMSLPPSTTSPRSTMKTAPSRSSTCHLLISAAREKDRRCHQKRSPT